MHAPTSTSLPLLASLAVTLWSCGDVIAADPESLTQANQGIVDMTNEFREENGLEKLTNNEELQKTATEFAHFMARESKYGHGADGRTPAERAEAAGYDYCVVRENIAYRIDPRKPTEEALAEHFTTGWKESPEHRENMLADHVTETGVAVASADGKTFYAVQLFGRPESAKFTIEIRNESNISQTIVFRSGDSKDEIATPPRTTLKLARCLPTTLSLASIDKQITVNQSTLFSITERDGKPALKKTE